MSTTSSPAPSIGSAKKGRPTRSPLAFSNKARTENNLTFGIFADVWQKPFVNVFKQCNVYESKRYCSIVGDVKLGLDKNIGKRVYTLDGVISAGNFINIPGRSRTSLTLTGPYIYMQLRAEEKFFTIHIDVNTMQGQVIRFSFSNLFKKTKVQGKAIHLPVNFNPEKWTMFSLDIDTLLESLTVYKYESIRAFQVCSSLKIRNIWTSSELLSYHKLPREISLPVPKGQSWAEVYDWLWMTPNAKSAGRLERDANSNASRASSRLSSRTGVSSRSSSKSDSKPSTSQPSSPSRESTSTQGRGGISISSPSRRAMENNENREPNVSSPTSGRPKRSARRRRRKNVLRSPTSQDKEVNPEFALDYDAYSEDNPPNYKAAADDGRDLPAWSHVDNHSLDRDQKVETIIASDRSPAPKFDSSQPPLALRDSRALANKFGRDNESLSPFGATFQNRRRKKRSSKANAKRQKEIEDRLQAEAEERRRQKRLNLPALHPDPMMELEKVIGYTPRKTKNLTWAPDGRTLVYSTNNLVILNDCTIGSQEFLTGHTSTISCLEFSQTGLLASAQTGKNPVIRIWDYKARQCIAYIMGHAKDVRCVCFSNRAEYLAAVGKDSHGRLQIIVWDLRDVYNGGKHTLVAKQISEFDIQRLVFSPFPTDPFNLVSCGHENIRFWRMKNKHLPASSLTLNEYSRNTFTDIAFEANYGENDHNTSKRFYVSTAKGALFQLNYKARMLECIYQLHNDSILSIAINEGFCVTASADKYLRVWPLDFSDYYLQAQHRSPVCQVSVSMDGLKVAVGVRNGSLGILDLASTAYSTKFRSHTDTINAVCFDPEREEFATVSNDGTIRIWHAISMEQIYEFYCPDEAVLCCAYHPHAETYQLACGFDTGCVRISDIAATRMLVEHQQHEGRVLELKYSHTGHRLFSVGEDMNLCVYNVDDSYAPIRMFTSYRSSHRSVFLPAAMSEDHATKVMEMGTVQTPGLNESSLSSVETSGSVSDAKNLPIVQGKMKGKHQHKCPRPRCEGARRHERKQRRSRKKKKVPVTYFSLALHPNGKYLATIGADPTTVIILETESLREHKCLATCGLPVVKAEFHPNPDLNELVVLLADCSFQRYQVSTGRLINQTQTLPPPLGRRGPSNVSLTHTSLSHVRHSTDTVSTNLSKELEYDQNIPENLRASTMTLSPHGRFLIAGTAGNSRHPMLRIFHYFTNNSKYAGHEIRDSDRKKTATQVDQSQSFGGMYGRTSETGFLDGVSKVGYTSSGDHVVTTCGDAIFVWRFDGDDMKEVPRGWEPEEKEESATEQSQSQNQDASEEPFSTFNSADDQTHNGLHEQENNILSSLRQELPPHDPSVSFIHTGDDNNGAILSKGTAPIEGNLSLNPPSALNIQSSSGGAAVHQAHTQGIHQFDPSMSLEAQLSILPDPQAPDQSAFMHKMDSIANFTHNTSFNHFGDAAELAADAHLLSFGQKANLAHPAGGLNAATAPSRPTQKGQAGFLQGFQADGKEAADEDEDIELFDLGDDDDVAVDSSRLRGLYVAGSGANSSATEDVKDAAVALTTAQNVLQSIVSADAQALALKRDRRFPFIQYTPKRVPFPSSHEADAQRDAKEMMEGGYNLNHSFGPSHRIKVGVPFAHRSDVVSNSNLPNLPLEANTHQVMGYNGEARYNLVWHPDSDVLAYSSGSLVVIEPLLKSLEPSACYRQRLMVGHTNDITTLAISSNGRFLASGAGGDKAGTENKALSSSTGQARVWDLRNDQCLAVLSLGAGHEAGVQRIVFSSDNALLVTISSSVCTAQKQGVADAAPTLKARPSGGCVVSVWDWQTETRVGRVVLEEEVHSVHWLPGRVSTPIPKRTLEDQAATANDPKFSPMNDCHFVTCGTAQTITCWSLYYSITQQQIKHDEHLAEQEEAIAQFKDQKKYQNSNNSLFHYNHAYVYHLGFQHFVTARHGRLTRSQSLKMKAFTAVDVSVQVHEAPSGQVSVFGVVVAATNTGTAMIWNMDGFLLSHWQTSHAEIDVIKFCPGSPSMVLDDWDHSVNVPHYPNPCYVVVGGRNGLVQVWQVPSPVHTQREARKTTLSIKPRLDREEKLDGSLIAAHFLPSGQVSFFGTSLGTIWYVTPLSGLEGYRQQAPSNDDDEKLDDDKNSSDNQTIQPMMPPVRIVNSHTAFINQVVFHPDKDYMASASSDGSVRVWQTIGSAKQEVECIVNQHGHATTLAPKVQQVMQFQVSNEYCLAVAFHPLNLWCLAGHSDGTLRLLDAVKLKVRKTFRLPNSNPVPITCIEFAYAGRIAIVGTLEGGIVFIDIVNETMELFPSIHAQHHRGARIDSIAVSPHDPRVWLVTDSLKRMTVWCSRWCSDDTKDSKSLTTSSLPAPSPIKGRHEQRGVRAKAGFTRPNNIVHDDAMEKPEVDSHQHTLLRKLVLSEQYKTPYIPVDTHPSYVPPTLATFSPISPEVILCSAAAGEGDLFADVDDDSQNQSNSRVSSSRNSSRDPSDSPRQKLSKRAQRIANKFKNDARTLSCLPCASPALLVYDFKNDEFLRSIMLEASPSSLSVHHTLAAVGFPTRNSKVFDLGDAILTDDQLDRLSLVIGPNASVLEHRAAGTRGVHELFQTCCHSDLVSTVALGPKGTWLAVASHHQMNLYTLTPPKAGQK